jgi:hypothetical protein
MVLFAMASIVKILKDKRVLTRESLILIGFVIVCIATICICDNTISDLRLKYAQANNINLYIRSLQSKPDKLNFIKAHRFSGSNIAPNEFQKLIRSCEQNYKMRIIKNKIVEHSILGNLSTQKYSIELLSWHDSYVFKALENMQNFQYGFINFQKICISRIAAINLRSPAIKVEILCTLFHR